MEKKPGKHFHSIRFSSSFFMTALLVVMTTIGGSYAAAEEDGGISRENRSNVELWCVAKNNAPDSALQGALDWVCGHGGADCSAIQPGGPCYEPTDVQFHASFAFNDYFLKSGLSRQSCDFSGSASLTSLNPSHGNCLFPSSFSIKNNSSAGDGSLASVTDSTDADTSAGAATNAVRAAVSAAAAGTVIMVGVTTGRNGEPGLIKTRECDSEKRYR
ncbi:PLASMODESMATA CALLOSE-BINDING PROTEIN 5-like isoform X2 [Nymphaea colorata]|uniref:PLASMODESMATA CALLOSE-BINDING PROTEIN 5-like isoform X2 n=1 Tax=Nymphaea colorata TaxID=210225 RepID=UPI00214F10A1|nr:PLASMODESMATA CALLOSE-BINDING PROTEIN 5-like isoform X2 [Nymphaea colorata]